MGRNYRDIVRELWDTVPQMEQESKEELYQAANNLFDQQEQFIIDSLLNLFGSGAVDISSSKAELNSKQDEYNKALDRYNKCLDMMDSLNHDEFLTIVDKYFDGFFELDGDK